MKKSVTTQELIIPNNLRNIFEILNHIDDNTAKIYSKIYHLHIKNINPSSPKRISGDSKIVNLSGGSDQNRRVV